MAAVAIILVPRTCSGSKKSWTDERSIFNIPKRSYWRRRF